MGKGIATNRFTLIRNLDIVKLCLSLGLEHLEVDRPTN